MKFFLFVVISTFISCSHHYPDFVNNLSFRNPTIDKSESIGEFSNGCLKGAQTFTGNEKGLIISQLRRGRYWGHPNLISTLTEAGEYFYKLNKKIILGDLSMSRGGPMIKGHNSHQNGLDVDVWFKILSRDEKLNFFEQETQEMKSIANLDVDQILLIKYFANHPLVERIFINHGFKKILCEDKSSFKLSKDEHHKLRPWWGHDDHIHVRLNCPKENLSCVSQKPIPEGDGCKEEDLKWWDSDEAKLKDKDPSEDEIKINFLDKIKKLPNECSFFQ